MGNFIDLTGRKFGRLTVVKRAPNKGKRTAWYCNCDCRKQNVVVVGEDLKYGRTKSCGCLKSETAKANGLKQKGKANLKNRRYNQYNLSDYEYGIGYIRNTNKIFLFDKEDFNKIKHYCWWINDDGYVIASLPNSNKKIRLHRLIMDENDPSIIIDHINHNTLDNRKCNLRKTDVVGNTRNGKLRSTNTTGVTGVRKRRNKWNAYITVNYKHINLGTFDDFNNAVNARKIAEEKYFGEYSYNNSMKINN